MNDNLQEEPVPQDASPAVETAPSAPSDVAPETEATPGTETSGEDEFSALQDLVGKLAAEREQLNDQLMRTMADFQNFRKRTQSEQASLRLFATESLLVKLLPVLDNFERTVAAFERGATVDSILNGVKAVEKQLRTIFEGQGMERIEAVGQPFDANLHEALGTVATTEFQPDTVVDELEPGYRLGDKVLRPARVRVAILPTE